MPPNSRPRDAALRAREPSRSRDEMSPARRFQQSQRALSGLSSPHSCQTQFSACSGTPTPQASLPQALLRATLQLHLAIPSNPIQLPFHRPGSSFFWCLFVCWFVCLFVCVFACLCGCSFVCLFVWLFVCLLACLLVCVCLFVLFCFCLFLMFFLFVCFCLYLFVCFLFLFVCLFVFLFV